jgi:predicted RNase H-like nuclease (RuvC/YqgF family)
MEDITKILELEEKNAKLKAENSELKKQLTRYEVDVMELKLKFVKVMNLSIFRTR